jgi:hypothetical protein
MKTPIKKMINTMPTEIKRFKQAFASHPCPGRRSMPEPWHKAREDHGMAFLN